MNRDIWSLTSKARVSYFVHRSATLGASGLVSWRLWRRCTGSSNAFLLYHEFTNGSKGNKSEEEVGGAGGGEEEGAEAKHDDDECYEKTVVEHDE